MTTSAAAVLARCGGDHEKARQYIRRLMVEYSDIAIEINKHETESKQKAQAAHV